MRKQKAQERKPLLSEFLDSYDRKSLLAALNTLELTEGWELFTAYARYAQRRYEVDALDLIAKGDSVQAAAYASGYAKGVEDISSKFLEGLKKIVVGHSDAMYMAVEEPEIVDHPTDQG